MRLTFLGTSAGTPTRQRNVTSQALEFDQGQIWLLDCGEGTQHQALRLGLKTARIERILITHLHGDHCLGLPGLLAHIGISGRIAPVEVIGPPGLNELVTTINRLTHAILPFPLKLMELPQVGADLPLQGDWRVQARALVHRIPCLGYVLTEENRPGRFHAGTADALGVPQHLRGRLQRGETVILSDGRRIESCQVADPPRPGRRIVLLGDTSDPRGIADAAQGCDLLVCEATYDANRQAKALAWGHMTSAMTGAFAAAIGAKALVLTHFSSRYGDGHSQLTVHDLVREARAACPGFPVWPANDLNSLTIAADGGIRAWEEPPTEDRGGIGAGIQGRSRQEA